MNQKVNKKIVSGTIVLSVAALISKVLSAVYRIPLENLVGNVGFYIYQQVYPIYGIGIAFALTGLPAFISKIMVENGGERERHALFFQLMAVLLALAILVFAVLQLFAGTIAGFMGDVRLAPEIQAVSWMFLLMPFLSDGRGYFQATLDMYPTAYSQVIEQIVRVGIIILVAYLACVQHWNLYRMGTLAMLAAPIAAVFASAALFPYCWNVFADFHWKDLRFNFWQLLKRVVLEGGILSIIAALMVLMQLVDSFTVKNGLAAGGMSNVAAQTQKGIYDRAQPIVQLGLVIGTAISATILPQITDYFKHRQQQKFKSLVDKSMRISLVVAMAVTFGLISIMPQLNHLLFGSYDLDITLSVYCLSIIFATMIVAFNSVLQSVNLFKSTITAIIVGLIVKVLLTKGMVTDFGIIGASYSTVIALIVILAVNWFISPKNIRHGIYDIPFLLKVTILSFMMLGIVLLIGFLLNGLMGTQSRLGDVVKLVIMISIGAPVFIIGALKTNLLTDSELELLPGFKHIRR